jgi:hypothetical protein
MPSDAPQFVPDNAPLPKQMQTPAGTPLAPPLDDSPLYTVPLDEQGYAMYHHQPQQQQHHHHQHHHQHHQAPTSMPDGMVVSPYEPAMSVHDMGHGNYGESMYGCTPTSIHRPATPVPHHKRPGSWGRVTSMEDMRPKKKTLAAHGSPYDTHMEMSLPLDQIPNAYGEMIPPHHHYAPPTSVPGPEWALPMRESAYTYEPQHHHHQHQHQHHQHQHMGEPMTTFFFDEQ